MQSNSYKYLQIRQTFDLCAIPVCEIALGVCTLEDEVFFLVRVEVFRLKSVPLPLGLYVVLNTYKKASLLPFCLHPTLLSPVPASLAALVVVPHCAIWVATSVLTTPWGASSGHAPNGFARRPALQVWQQREVVNNTLQILTSTHKYLQVLTKNE